MYPVLHLSVYLTSLLVFFTYYSLILSLACLCLPGPACKPTLWMQHSCLSIYLSIYVCTKKIVIERTRDLIYLKFVATDFFLKIIGRAKRAPHWGVQSKFRVIYICRYVCLSWSKKRRRKYVGQTRACSKSVLGGKIRPVTPVLLISTLR